MGLSPQRQLERFLDELIETKVFHSRRDIAAACGTTDAGLSKILNNPKRRLTVEQCLRLASKTQTGPALILRLAGRPDIAALVESLWPRSRGPLALTQSERELVDLWRDLQISDRHHIHALIAICAEKARARTNGHLGPQRVAPRPSKLTRVAR